MDLKTPLRRGDLRDALVTYARRVTGQGLIDAMSLRAAARDLGVSSGAVYRHFCDKDALLKAVAHEGFLQLRAKFFAIRAEGDAAASVDQAVDRAFALGRSFVGFAYDNPTLWRMMFGRIGVLCRADLVEDPQMTRYTALDCIAENCRDLYRLGALPDVPQMEDVRFVWSAIHGAADLAQSGLRLDDVGQLEVADQTTARSLRALGCAPQVIQVGQNRLETSP